jgi:hypothetical protein
MPEPETKVEEPEAKPEVDGTETEDVPKDEPTDAGAKKGRSKKNPTFPA